MNTYPLSKLLHRLGTEPDLLDQFRATPDMVLDAAGVSAEARKAVERGDFPWLLDHGVHPLLLMQLSLALNMDIRRAYATSNVSRTASKSG